MKSDGCQTLERIFFSSLMNFQKSKNRIKAYEKCES